MTEPDTTHCQVCGTSGPTSTKFCTSCGALRPVPAPDAAASPTIDAPPTQSASAPGCQRCGADLGSATRFCRQCGHAIGAAPAAPPPPTTPVVLAKPPAGPPVGPSFVPPAAPLAVPPAVFPTGQAGAPRFVASPDPHAPVATLQPTPAPRRRTARLVLVIVAVVALLAGGGVAGRAFLSKDAKTESSQGDDKSSGNVERPAGESDSATDTPTDKEGIDDTDPNDAPTPGLPAVTATTEPSPEVTAVPDEAICWNNVPAPKLRQCTMPTGADGLKYVFPGFDFAAEICDTSGERIRRQQRFIYACAEEGDVSFNFSEFDVHAAGEAYYTANAGATGSPIRGDLLRWEFFNSNGEYKGILMYANDRWGVTVYSTNATKLDQTLENLARRMVREKDLLGRKIR